VQINKQLLLSILFIVFYKQATAEEFHSVPASEQGKNAIYYVGINPLALAAFLPDGMGTVATAFGIISGQEFGVSLYGGFYYMRAHSLEMRLSTGPADAVVWDTQLQFGYLWYPFEQFLGCNRGLSSGFMLRQFFWNNRITDHVTFSFTPELLLGWRFIFKKLAIDLRAGWNIASVTWSTAPYTKTATAWIPFPFNLALTTGIMWTF